MSGPDLLLWKSPLSPKVQERKIDSLTKEIENAYLPVLKIISELFSNSSSILIKVWTVSDAIMCK